jgi:hypothetical protein
MTRLSLLLCSLLVAVPVKAAHKDLDHRGLDELQCRCEVSPEHLYNTRRLATRLDQNEEVGAVFHNGIYVIDGIRLLPTSDTACSSGSVRHRRNLQQSYTHMNEEDKAELVAELAQMDENEDIFKPDKMRKLKGSKSSKASKSSKSSKGTSKGKVSVEC